MKVNLHDKTGKKLQTKIDLDVEIWDVPFNEDLVSQAIRVYLHNQRKGTAHTKTRAEVSGGGRKPWRQKGTGRARHGSIRSPLWVKGGVAFGPRSHKVLKKMPRKMSILAAKCVLSERLRRGEISFVDKISIGTKLSTKSIDKLIGAFPGANKLLVMSGESDDFDRIKKSGSNLESLIVDRVQQVNIYKMMNASHIIITQEAVDQLQQRYK